MKCIVMKNSGHIVRTTNHNAALLVKAEKAQYTKKSAWRQFRKVLLETVDKM